MSICYGHVDMQPVNMLRLVNDFICPSALGILNKYPLMLMLLGLMENVSCLPFCMIMLNFFISLDAYTSKVRPNLANFFQFQSYWLLFWGPVSVEELVNVEDVPSACFAGYRF